MIRQGHHINGHRLFFCSLLILLCIAPDRAQESNRKLVKKVEAEYPSLLKKRGIGGTVRLKVIVKPDGVVKDTEVLGGNPILADSAQKAVSQWRFAQSSTETILEVSVVFDPRS
jgi:TonB family protein